MKLDRRHLKHRVLSRVRAALGDPYNDSPPLASVGKALRETRAALRSNSFVCSALWGSAQFNASPAVLSDGSVVCSCRDPRKQIVLGHVEERSLGEIWSGEEANRLRRSFMEGKLPHRLCAGCPSLVETSEPPALSDVKPLSSVLVENISTCNYRCLGCPIEEANETRTRPRLPLEEARGVYEQLGQSGVKKIGLYNFGEPFLDREIPEKLRSLRAAVGEDVLVITSTNGMLLDGPAKREAAIACLDAVFFSIDGLDTETLRRYQVGGDFDVAYANMKRLVEARDMAGSARPRVFWKYVLFRWNCAPEMLEAAVELARKTGVDALLFVPTSSPPLDGCEAALEAWRDRRPLLGFPRDEQGFIGYATDAGRADLARVNADL